MGSEMKRGTKETLPTDEQEEVGPPMDHRYTQETYVDTMGRVAILKQASTLTDWHHFNSQSLLSGLQYK